MVPKSPPLAAREWCRLLLQEVICCARIAAGWTIPSLPGVMGVHNAFLPVCTVAK